MRLACVVLAAGLGKRMNSSLPKVLHTVSGITMLQHVLNTICKLKPQRIIVVVGAYHRKVEEIIKTDDIAQQNKDIIRFAYQRKPMGTADALLKASRLIKGFNGSIIVINGDTPLINHKTLNRVISFHRKKKDIISILSFQTNEPGSYGRIIRNEKGDVISIVEDRDATPSHKTIKEVNSGIYVIEADALKLLKEIEINKSKGEYYLTDIVKIATRRGIKTSAYCIGSEEECSGVNTLEELERVRRYMRHRIIKGWMKRGINFIDPSSVFISSYVKIDKETTIYPNVHLEGNTKIGKYCTIYPNVRIYNSIIEDGVVIKDSTLIEDSIVRKKATVGPFAHLRPDSNIGMNAKIGNFVEVKKSIIGSGTKASHLTYLGDARIGRNVNIGAGMITCNYDGYKKHTTIIGDRVFVGSDAQLIAPVKVGKGAYIGAGSTITKDVPPNSLALSRVEQKNIQGWALKRAKSKRQTKKVKSKK